MSCVLLIFAVAASIADQGNEGEEGTNQLKGNVDVSFTRVTLECPYPKISTQWKIHQKNKEKTENNIYVINDYTDQTDGLHYCQNGKETYYFFTRIKVCENCIELNVALASGLIIGDILLTLGVILIVYLCTRMKSGSATPQRSTHIRQTGAPTPPDPDYQSLNPATRNRDVYAEPSRKH
ncbi:hypothetical protein P4O66_017915 [Electrophorus voltai]|uniref:CD3 gamma/delta subunit Ig-like domain-containing protein n=1 Tax=Electrophorus voltai TaxID=2609070 RepID=A0AAD9DME6_9TELE|nr:hypothetical protein P4O66_017915 [Electrophorus voltai]